MATMQCQNDARQEVNIRNCDGKSVGSVAPMACDAKPCEECKCAVFVFHMPTNVDVRDT